jgi:uncharacterized protein (TIGR03118 family)
MGPRFLSPPRLLVALTAAAVVAGTVGGSPAAQASAATSGFRQFNIVSDQPGHARITDPNVVNAWGLALGNGTPLWVANNGTSTATIYRGAVSGQPPSTVPLVVSIPGGAPTGQVFNPTSDFVVHGPGGSGPAVFLFVSEAGRLVAWNPTADLMHARTVNRDADAVYKGLALVTAGHSPMLLATDFVGGHLDAWNSTFHRVGLGSKFTDPSLPAGYGPFNVMVAGDRVYVSYAKQDPSSADEVAGPGRGFVDAYTATGAFVRRIASRGTLNAPWGMAIAPRGFGGVGGDLLIGNFGDGRISAFDARTGAFHGRLRDAADKLITIDGLWALQVGDSAAGGVHDVWFSAGPADESHGLVGLLRTPAE